MNKSALYDISYGVYIIGTKDGERNVGCVANSVIQVTSDPMTLAVSINKDNHTNPCLLRTGGFTVAVLSEHAEAGLIGTFGFQSSRKVDKFASVESIMTDNGLPVVTAGVCSYFICKVLSTHDAITHTIVLAEIVGAEVLSREPAMTYAYYHKVVKGGTPKNAPTYIAAQAPPSTGTKEAYVCAVCGYQYPGSKDAFDAEPDTFRCPICGVEKCNFHWKTVSE